MWGHERGDISCVPDIPSIYLRYFGGYELAIEGFSVSCHLLGGLVLADPMGVPSLWRLPTCRFPRGAGSDGHKGKGQHWNVAWSSAGGWLPYSPYYMPARCHATAMLAGWLIWPEVLESHRGAAHRERHGSAWSGSGIPGKIARRWPPYLLPLRSAISSRALIGSWLAWQAMRSASPGARPLDGYVGGEGTASIWEWSRQIVALSNWYPIVVPSMDVYGALGRVPDGTPSPTSGGRNARPGQASPRDVTLQGARASRGR